MTGGGDLVTAAPGSTGEATVNT